VADPAQKVDEPLPESAPRPVAEEEGVILSAEDEEELEQAIAEAHVDLRAGRCITFDEMRAKLRVA
jgi:hypothetical protein